MAHAVGYSLHSQTLTSFYVSSNSTAPSNPEPEYTLSFYLGIYVAFSVASAIIGTFRYYYVYTGSIRASRVLFDKLCFTILRTPLRWMDTVPLGRILNRFTADFNVVDARLSNDFSFGMNNIFRLLGVIVAGFVPYPSLHPFSISNIIIPVSSYHHTLSSSQSPSSPSAYTSLQSTSTAPAKQSASNQTPNHLYSNNSAPLSPASAPSAHSQKQTPTSSACSAKSTTTARPSGTSGPSIAGWAGAWRSSVASSLPSWQP